MELYCGKQYQRSFVQATLSVGSLIGLFIMNVVSDSKGRRYALLLDLLIAISSSISTYAPILVTFLGAEAEITGLLAIGTFMSGFSGYSLIVISYIMLGDICE